MMYIRRLWLASAIIFTVAGFYLFVLLTTEDPHYGRYNAHLRIDPEKYQRQFPVTSFIALPTGTAKSIPRIEYDFSKQTETTEARKVRLQRRDAVKENFIHAWRGYKQHAWAKDEVMPVTGNWRNSFGGWGATMVDTMDTLWLMGLKEDFEQCVAAVKDIDFTTNTENSLNVFETTIRYLGGLLAAHDLSEGRYPILLTKARDLGEILYIVFDTPNHMPIARWSWQDTADGRPLGSAGIHTLNAELGSLTLEFTRLSQVTGDPKYFDAVQRVMTVMAEHQNATLLPGLWPTIIDAKELSFNYGHFTFGGMADSTYEYLPKVYQLLGGLDSTYKNMYLQSLETAKEELFYRPNTPDDLDILFSGNAVLIEEPLQVKQEAQGQHLACFIGGMVAIASKIFSRPDDLSIAKKFVDGCIWAYSSTPSGLMPETFNIARCHKGVTPDPDSGVDVARGDCTWSDDKYFTAVWQQQPSNDVVADLTKVEGGKWWVKQKSLFPPYTDLNDNRYILRPEAIESIFILYRITGDPSLLDSAWTMFQAIEKATRTEVAHAGVKDVRLETPVKMDRMESFWLSETLKYFYLIFEDPNVMSLDEWVLNTEAHPFRRPKAGEKLSL